MDKAVLEIDAKEVRITKKSKKKKLNECIRFLF